MKIRQAVASDAKALTECMVQAYSPYLDRLDKDALPPLHVDYLEEIKHYPVWVAELKGELVGGIILVLEEQASIANIAVSPNSQGKGVGKVLIKHGIAQAQQAGFDELHLATHQALAENLSLYKHLGWQESGRQNSKVFMVRAL
ncbi:GNAT family N-acetyltransferase [Paraferrimonas sp. SM1919]|uniref:GNAT family N-acetyltransferase n=1 Tax=Paraferrimonas sp. SM1919 TaxID=2662263 RepID=UPI0013D42F33|nr:GNAT family N-acetyltransferase [Paraferrimonas sp. SM1919]